MKKLTKIIVMTLITTIISCGISYQQAEAKNIYFAGEYKCKNRKLVMEQYSSPENSPYGKNVGYFKFSGFANKKKNTTAEIYRKKENMYQTKEGFITFIVKKKAVIVKGGLMDFAKDKMYSVKGKYKLKKRYPRP